MSRDRAHRDVANQLPHRLAGHAAKHIKDGEFDDRQGYPERQARQLVIALVDRRCLEEIFKIAGSVGAW
jgi:hypothetical protein